jgi:hypothetical protein
MTKDGGPISGDRLAHLDAFPHQRVAPREQKDTTEGESACKKLLKGWIMLQDQRQKTAPLA